MGTCSEGRQARNTQIQARPFINCKCMLSLQLKRIPHVSLERVHIWLVFKECLLPWKMSYFFRWFIMFRSSKKWWVMRTRTCIYGRIVLLFVYTLERMPLNQHCFKNIVFRPFHLFSDFLKKIVRRNAIEWAFCQLFSCLCIILFRIWKKLLVLPISGGRPARNWKDTIPTLAGAPLSFIQMPRA